MSCKGQNIDGAIAVPNILLPYNADMYSWAVIACDQFTSDKSYWQQVEKIAEGKPSTFHLIFPEIYLKDNPQRRTAQINSNMKSYLEGGIFRELQGGFILVERTVSCGVRKGIVLCIDLERYSFRQEDRALIRSTEETVADRLPPRIEIRRGALLELPHIMLLYNDPQNSVLGAARRGKIVYDFDLNMGGGHVKGTFIDNAEEVINAFYSLVSGKNDKFLFAVGDGNHSLAAAKLLWDELKTSLSDEEKAIHPARYALCEAVNIFDDALLFHPIHRFVETSSAEKFIDGWNLSGASCVTVKCADGERRLPFPEDIPQGIRLLDGYISSFLKEYGGAVDYVHGDDQIECLRNSGVCIRLPAIEKSAFFDLIARDGNLPKKTFSMGEGCEKRYYIEAKRIK